MSEQSRSADTTRHVARLARRLSTDVEYMASVVAIYQTCERLSDDALAERMGIPTAMIPRLALCKRPQPESPDFAGQVRQLAAYTGIDAGQLAHLIRQAEALSAMDTLPRQEQLPETGTQPASMGLGWLAAARDRMEPRRDRDEPVDKAGDEDQLEPE